ncbi:MAG: hypothetical protein DRN42_03685 [Thermoplasmata archaeon]|nr:MAG: hypothetical protein DRN42_03685 [Thermoplasmata archaeon]
MRYTSGGKMMIIFAASLFLYSYFRESVAISAGALTLTFFILYRQLLFRRALKFLRVDLTRWCPEEVVFRGDTLTVEGELRSNLPLTYKLKQEIPENFTLEGGENRVEGVLGPGESSNFRMVLKAVRRGRGTLPPVRIEVLDPCGFFTSEIDAGEPLELWVHASWQEVIKARAVGRRGEIEVRGVLQRGVEGTRGDLRRIREWMPGDRLRDVAWKASSRLQKLLTREFDVEVELPVVAALDISRGMRESSGRWSKLDHAMNLVLQLAAVFERRGQPFGLILYDETRVVRYLKPRKGAFDEVLEELLLLPPPSERPRVQWIEGGGVRLGGDEKRFVESVSPFITGTKESLPARMTGHYDVARRLSREGEESTSVIYITDMSFGVKGLLQASLLLKEGGIRGIVISPRPYLYTLRKDDLTPEELKAAVRTRRVRRRAAAVLSSSGMRFVEVTPGQEMEHVMKALRGVMR